MPVNEQKAAVRRAVRASFDEAKRQQESRLICQHVLAWEPYQRAQVVGGYMPMKHEADILPVLQHALESGKTLVLPRCGQAPQMTFYQVKHLGELVRGSFGLLEPSEDAPVVPMDRIDLLLTPLEAITRDGLRLGKGGGYYDCLLARQKIATLGIVLSWQWVEKLPRETWDQPLHAAADQQGIHLF